jgi:hypothetical protein
MDLEAKENRKIKNAKILTQTAVAVRLTLHQALLVLIQDQIQVQTGHVTSIYNLSSGKNQAKEKMTDDVVCSLLSAIFLIFGIIIFIILNITL